MIHNCNPVAIGAYRQLDLHNCTRPGGLSDGSDGTYSYCQGNTEADTYLFDVPEGIGDIINAVLVYCRVACSINSYAIKYEPILYKSGSSIQDQGWKLYYSSSWAWKYETWTTNPFTDSRWQISDLEDLEFGYQVERISGSYPRVSETYLAIDSSMRSAAMAQLVGLW